MKKKLCILCGLAICFAMLSNCDTALNSFLGVSASHTKISDPVPEPDPIKKNWAIVVYMAADNDLESAAILDFNELEAVGLADSSVAVYVLLDRSAAYDSTNGNWSGTRLYEILDDSDGMNNRIVSRQLDCLPLGLTIDKQTNLDMAQPFVLDTLLRYVKNLVMPEHTALIMWGHGTGWRGSAASNGRAFAFDDFSDTYMFLRQMGEVLTQNTVDFLGLDVCFGATLEVVYEMKDASKWLAGSPGISPINGWDYHEFLSLFLKTELTPKALALCSLSQYQKQYALSANTSFGVFDLGQVNELAHAFDNFSSELSLQITNTESRAKVMNIFKNRCKSYTNQTYPTDCYLDIKDMVANLTNEFPLLVTAGTTLNERLDKVLVQAWSSSGTPSLGVFFSSLSAPGVFASNHSDLYKKGSNLLYQNSFVRDFDSWVPHKIPQTSVLDKLLYVVF